MTSPALSAATRHGLLFVLSSPSGAGKSTLSRRLLAADERFVLSISATTRPRRPAEVHGEDYLFVNQAEFDRMVAGGEMLEHARVFDNHYGTPRAPVEAAVMAGRDVLFDVDWQGTQQLRQSGLRDLVVSVFLLPPSIAELERRLRARGQDDDAVIRKRMAKSQAEISHWAEYDYVLINDDFERCFSQIETIVEAERMRRPRQRDLLAHVDSLNAEFERMFG